MYSLSSFASSDVDNFIIRWIIRTFYATMYVTEPLTYSHRYETLQNK